MYNFWDRIGYLLSLVLDLKIEPKEIYFPRVIKKIEKLNSQSANFKFLKEFSEDEYKNILNENRKSIVHYKQQDTSFRFEWLNNLYNREAIKKLQDEKDKLPNLLKSQMSLTIKDFKSAVLLIHEKY